MTARKSRILFVLPSFAGGGAERVLLTVLGRLDRERFSPGLLVLSDAGPLKPLVPDDIDVRVLGTGRVRSALPLLRRAIRDAAPDAVLSTMAYLNFAVLSVGPGGPLYFVREANMPDHTARQIGSHVLTRLLYRLLYRRASAILCNARPMRDALAAWGVAQDRLVAMPNPVDVDMIRKGVEARVVPGDGRRFVAAGRLTEQKGFDRLVDWFRNMPVSDRLCIFGDGPQAEQLRAQIDGAGVGERILLKGFDTRVADWIAGADAVLLPSRWEGMPNVALESLALGTPVIAHREAGGIAELADATSGHAVKVAEDGAAFLAAMQEVEATLPRLKSPRPNLLPTSYHVNEVVHRYETLLSR